jgi:ferritin
MVEPGSELGFLFKSANETRIDRKLIVEHLERNDTIKRLVFRFIDDPKTAPAKFFEYFIAP